MTKKDPKTLDDDREPYDRQSFEDDKPWAAFKAYRDLGPANRSHDATVKALGRDPEYKQTTYGWSCENEWKARCAAWDSYQDRIERDKMKIRHLSIAKSMQMIGMSGIRGLKAKIDAVKPGENLYDVLGVSAKECRMFIDDGQKLERLNMGEPGEIVETRHAVDDTVGREVADMVRRAAAKE